MIRFLIIMCAESSETLIIKVGLYWIYASDKHIEPEIELLSVKN